MKPDDFIYLCEKYDCNITPYLISELGKTAAERLAFLLKDEVVETKSQIDVIASCQAVVNLVNGQMNTVYQLVLAQNDIPIYCDCTSLNSLRNIILSLCYVQLKRLSYENNTLSFNHHLIIQQPNTFGTE